MFAIRFSAVAITAVLSVFLAAAASAQALKIGFVDRDRIVRESDAAKRVQAKLEKEFAARQAELERLEKRGRELDQALQKESVTLPEAERVARERQLAQVTREFQRLQREFREDLNLRKNEEWVSLQERATKVINDIAEREKYDLILQEAVYRSPKIDITDKVLKALTEK